MKLDEIENERQACAKVSLQPEKPRFPFPTVQFSKLRPGKYIMRLLPEHELKNKTGMFCMSEYEIPTSAADPKQVFKFLHPRSLSDPKGPDAYWGLETLILEAKGLTKETGEPLLSDEYLSKIFERLATNDRVWMPVLINAVEEKTKKDGTPCHPKYPEYKPNPNPNGKMIDMVLEIDKKRGYYEALYQLIKANPGLDDYKEGYYIELNKGEKGSTFTLRDQTPLSALVREECQRNYPDLYANARRWSFKTPQVIYDAIKETYWWKQLEDIEFELEKPKSPTSGIKLNRKKTEEPVSDETSPLASALKGKSKKEAPPVTDNDPYPDDGGVSMDDVPF